MMMINTSNKFTWKNVNEETKNIRKKNKCIKKKSNPLKL